MAVLIDEKIALFVVLNDLSNFLIIIFIVSEVLRAYFILGREYEKRQNNPIV